MVFIEKSERRSALRSVGAIAVAGALVASLVSCSTDSEEPTSDASGHVRLWSWVPPDVSEQPAAYQASADRWIEAGEGRSYEYVLQDAGQYNALLRTALLSGEPPEIANVNSDSIAAMVDSGQLTDITDFVATLPALDSVMFERYKLDGRVYSYWVDVQAEGVLYNKTLFEELGLEIPTTLAEMAALSAPLRAAGVEPLLIPLAETWIGADLWFQGLAYSDASDTALARAEAGEIPWTSPEFVGAGEYLEAIAESGMLIDAATSIGALDGYQLFATGEAAMFYPGAWWSHGAIEPIVDGEWEIDVFALPPIEAGVTPRAIGSPASTFVFPSEAENQEAAFELVRFMASPEGQNEFAIRGSVPGVAGSPSPDPAPFNAYPGLLALQENAASRVIFIADVMAALTTAAEGIWRDSIDAAGIAAAMQDAAP